MLIILIYCDLVCILQVVASEMIVPMLSLLLFRLYVVVGTKQTDFCGRQQGIQLATHLSIPSVTVTLFLS